jgi:hypothetical protein
VCRDPARCRFSRLSHALWAATDNSIVDVEEGFYSEDSGHGFSSTLTITANNVTMRYAHPHSMTI